MNIKKLSLFALLIIFIFLFAGCSQSGLFSSGSSPNTGATGSVAFNVAWPQSRTGAAQVGGKYIPSNTSSISVSVTGEGLSSALTSSYGSGTRTITISSLPVGTKTAQISCIDSGSNILSDRKVNFTVEGGKTVTVSATLGITVNDNGFVPQNMNVPAGTTLLFVNSGSQTHTLAGSSPFSMNVLRPGESVSLAFSSYGTFSYYDAGNTSLTGSVVTRTYINKIACQYRSGGVAPYQIMLLDAANNYQKSVITNTASDKVDPSFSWDGTKITFRDNDAAKIQILSGTNYSQESTTGQAGALPCFNHDATKIIYSLIAWPNGDIYQMNTDGSSVSNLTNSAAMMYDHPSFNYDGTKIVFMSLANGKIYTMNSNGTAITAITSPVGALDYDPSFSWDGNWIVFSRWVDAQHQYITAIRSDGTGSTIPLTTVTDVENSHPVFSPDDTKILFAADRARAQRDLYTINFNGANSTAESGLTMITNGTGTEDFYSPDWK